MYLLVFVTLVIALTGIYAQVLSLQTARLFSNQTTVAQTMLRWHSTAVSLAQYAQITPPPGAAGCDLTTGGPVGITCANGAGSITVQPSTTPPPGGMTLCAGGVPAPCWTSLPQGYQTNPYTFYSIFYQPAAGQNYVITFVPPPTIGAANPPPGFIALPDGALASPHIGITLSNLLLQFKNKGMAPISYGMVATVAGVNYLVIPTISNGTTSFSKYSLPTGGVIPSGSVAVLSSP